jgi:organic radical activating enzyme
MHQPPTLKITEIFPSIQGEGLRQGEPTIFVRFTGCNLCCAFCDTKYAWKGGKDYTTIHLLSRIKRTASRFPASWICLTGGEPLLQNVEELVQMLKKEKFKIQVETNATIYRPLAVDWYSVSPKPEEYFFRPEYKNEAREVKLVVTKGLNFQIVQRLREEFASDIPLLLQPQSNRKWSMIQGMSLLKKGLRLGYTNIRLSAQLHKVFGLP